MSDAPVAQQILIVGAGVFGLSTALSLLSNPTYNASRITIIDASPSLPNPSGSSVDANRIVRADYAGKHYAQLASQAQELWRDTRKEAWGGEGRYYEPGFVLTADEDKDAYLMESLANVRRLAEESGRNVDSSKIRELHGQDEIRKATGYDGVSGDHGYANFNSGWADAEACVAHALRRIQSESDGRVAIRPGAQVARLVFSGSECQGVELVGGEQILAELTVLAAGAWSPSLIDLQGRCLATGQTMAFLEISPEEQAAMGNRPTVMNMSRGTFIIPPRGKELKIARHGYGYRNPVKISKGVINPDAPSDLDPGYVEVSVPKVGIPIPLEAEEALREALGELLPQLANRPFTRTRICWYCDTPSGDFLITFHPDFKRLFLATGGSGHGFKFFPVIGDKIVAAIQGTLEPELAQIWRWRSEEDLRDTIKRGGDSGGEFTGCEDGSRAGPKGMVLEEEMQRQKSR
ncbi:uncharacterized protein Z519_05346 [Cladophialophora bantiana CBS 173.52]|uniref:FAD dependent oxidoreductase domain-containing protein n=1 Tax=Cladophialophora bantiana (strain ATCC 10958 / CBS 173.52 / CDC B-1940 / NIH 8579) TaxID=1442370 RepID=A0A0D2HT70_CLAB1|nr:uncharacterized protein Z519_05346 [Cladophialophora bantiana CBS 173.52]KIW94030.1 hypothetical protein Z519_05346 [Cladophialophora bantiana CBS 173.52]